MTYCRKCVNTTTPICRCKQKYSTLIHKLQYSFGLLNLPPDCQVYHTGRSPLFFMAEVQCICCMREGVEVKGGHSKKQSTSETEEAEINDHKLNNTELQYHLSPSPYQFPPQKTKTERYYIVTDLPSQLSGIHHNCEQLLQCALESLL